ncbi:20S proteasome subunit A/B [Salinigranum sp. GCM10025319]|uniref:20S proteasome subunit A/B n=1 Tax=Salinigranum sp. GCM10025319 TaxID=3252687 RepID=UPI0036135591
MATIVGVRCRDGVVLAGDRLRVRDGRVESRNRQHVFDFDLDGDAVGGATVGSDVDRFADRFGGELRSYRLERGPVPLAAVERIGSDVASETGCEAIVAARDRDEDEDGRAALRAVYPDGSTLSDPPMALGSGASLALGQLEAADLDAMSVDDCESFLRETFEAVAERDPGTGDEVDVWTLADEDG